MAVNQVTLANGEELINLTNDTVSELSLLSGAAAHDASGTQITGKAQYINPNLIINHNFKINQRGQTSYNSYEYGYDGWHGNNSSGSVVKTEQGIILNLPSGASWVQSIEELPAGVYTYSAHFANTLGAHLYLQTPLKANGEYVGGTTGIQYVTFEIKEPLKNALIGFYNGNPEQQRFEINNVKLELGTIATPYVDPDPALELVKCQRTLQFHTTGDIDPIDLRPTMRITPTVTQMEDGRWMYNAEL